jgi:uncharacterized membrane protein YkvA (DUF1232 family)
MAMKKGLFGQPILDGYRQLVRNSKYRWVVLLGTLVYLVSPIDISPDVFPVVGWIDDGLIATIAITEVTQLMLDRKRNLRAATQAKSSTTASEATVVDVDSIVIS